MFTFAQWRRQLALRDYGALHRAHEATPTAAGPGWHPDEVADAACQRMVSRVEGRSVCSLRARMWRPIAACLPTAHAHAHAHAQKRH